LEHDRRDRHRSWSCRAGQRHWNPSAHVARADLSI
jgi:hypothetical protein